MINLRDAAKKQGALDALELLLDSRLNPIRIKNEDEDSEKSNIDQEAETLNDLLDEIGLDCSAKDNGLIMPKAAQIVDVDEEDEKNGEKETAEEKQARLDQAKKDNEADTLERDLKSIENEAQQVAADKEKKEKEAAYAEHAKQMNQQSKLISSGKLLVDYRWFFTDLENAINSQIEESNSWEDSYDSFNATYADSGVLMPGEKRSERKQKPIINVYFDLSGSLSNSTIEKAKQSLSFLTDLENAGDIESYTVYYFASNISEDPSQVGGGTTAFPEILKHVKETDANNVIIFTDSDFDYQSGYIPDLPYVKIEGCMWWMWSRGQMAKKAWPHLTSANKNATYHYTI